MKVQEIMERAGMTETGRAVAWIKDAMEEMNTIVETHVTTSRIDIVEGTRFYPFPRDMIKVLDIRGLNHRNDNDEYRSLPRMTFKPPIKDADGN